MHEQARLESSDYQDGFLAVFSLNTQAHNPQRLGLSGLGRSAWVQDFKLFMDDDAALLKAANAQWAVTPLTDEGRLGTEPTTEPAVMICDDAAVSIGASRDCSVVVTGTAVSFPLPSHRLNPLT